MSVSTTVPTFQPGETANLWLRSLLPEYPADAFVDGDVTVTFELLNSAMTETVIAETVALLEDDGEWRVIADMPADPGTYYARCVATVGTAKFIHTTKIKVKKT